MTKITDKLYICLKHIVSIDIKSDYIYIRTVDGISHIVGYENQDELDSLLIKLNIWEDISL